MTTSHATDALTQMRRNAAKAEALLSQLANAHRLMILCTLVTGEHSVGELSENMDISQSSLSQHLAKLREARLVECEKRGQMVYYHIASMEVQALLSVLHLIYCKSA